MAWEGWYTNTGYTEKFSWHPSARIALAALMQFGTSARKGNLAPGTQTAPSHAWPATHPLAWAENPPSRPPKCHRVPTWCGEDPPMPRSNELGWNPIACGGASHDARPREQILSWTTEGDFFKWWNCHCLYNHYSLVESSLASTINRLKTDRTWLNYMPQQLGSGQKIIGALRWIGGYASAINHFWYFLLLL